MMMLTGVLELDGVNEIVCVVVGYDVPSMTFNFSQTLMYVSVAG